MKENNQYQKVNIIGMRLTKMVGYLILLNNFGLFPVSFFFSRCNSSACGVQFTPRSPLPRFLLTILGIFGFGELRELNRGRFHFSARVYKVKKKCFVVENYTLGSSFFLSFRSLFFGVYNYGLTGVLSIFHMWYHDICDL